MSESERRRIAQLQHAFSPIARLMDDPEITDINCNGGDGLVWVAKGGKRYPSGVTLDPLQRERIINLAAAAAGTVCSREQPELQCKIVEFGVRFQATLAPITVGPAFSIRKFGQRVLTLPEYIESGVMTREQGLTLERAVLEKKSVLIAGATSSGKTTLLNTLLTLPWFTESRALILEDTPEIRCTIPDREHMLASGATTMRDLVRLSLRMAPDRLIIGEVRDGAAALDLLQAGNTGHQGWLSTIHANSAVDALWRLDELTQQVTVTSQCSLIARAVDQVVFLQHENGQRQVREIVQVDGFKDGLFLAQPIA